jgi:hypothetical protein
MIYQFGGRIVGFWSAIDAVADGGGVFGICPEARVPVENDSVPIF